MCGDGASYLAMTNTSRLKVEGQGDAGVEGGAFDRPVPDMGRRGVQKSISFPEVRSQLLVSTINRLRATCYEPVDLDVRFALKYHCVPC